MAQERFLDGPMPDIMAQWRQYFSWLEPRAGESIIDVGCDTGDAARFLAQEYPAVRHIIGVEADERRYERALERWKRAGGDPRVEFRRADARALPFEDATFDKAICAEMLEFVDPAGDALTELRRVLKPGGTALVIHTDWETQVFSTLDRARSRRAVLAFAGDGQGAGMGRRLSHLCREAGFAGVEPLVYTLVNSEWQEDHYAPRVVELMSQWLTETEFGAAELVQWRADIAEAVAAGRFFYAVSRFVCRCRR